jgi:hypothetical protein
MISDAEMKENGRINAYRAEMFASTEVLRNDLIVLTDIVGKICDDNARLHARIVELEGQHVPPLVKAMPPLMLPDLSPATAGWTDDRVEALTKLWCAGTSSAKIALVLDITRSAVMGRVRVLGLSTKDRTDGSLPRGRNDGYRHAHRMGGAQ